MNFPNSTIKKVRNPGKKGSDTSADEKNRDKAAREKQKELLEMKRSKWMNDREISLINERVRSEESKGKELKGLQSSVISESKEIEPAVTREIAPAARSTLAIGPDETNRMLDKLTEKLTAHIRQEVQREIRYTDTDRFNVMKESVSENVDNYLQNELAASHTCKICFEVMLPPDHVPILLFPCGHTFCKQCVEHKTAQGGHLGTTIVKCPYCRVQIESKAINQSLKELIEHLHVQTNKLTKNPVALVATQNSKKKQNEYEQKLQSCKIREKILKNELLDVEEENKGNTRKKGKVRETKSYLEEKQREVDEKIQLLQEEKELIQVHLQQQIQKEKEFESLEQAIQEKKSLVEETLGKLRLEIEKLELLSES